jgi:hypothetical protein
MSNNPVVVIEDGITFSPFYFYTEFLETMISCFDNSTAKKPIISYKLTDDKDPIMGRYRIDPISIPLLLSLTQQLKMNQNEAIKLELSNYPATSKLLAFLYRSDFFYVAGQNKNPLFPMGKDLMTFDERYIGGFSSGNIRAEHKIRCYSINDEPLLKAILLSEKSEDEKRDYSVEHYAYKVFQHFEVLLRESTNQFASLYVDILSELITNGIMHSGTDVFALMFSDKFSIKFSIADNGVGLYKSLEKKKDNDYYKKFDLSNKIFESTGLKRNTLTNSLVSIFETLFYSMAKKRLGLFDLMVNVVNRFSGYFRLHNECSQVVFSPRLGKELESLGKIREEIRKLYFEKEFKPNGEAKFDAEIKRLISEGEVLLLELFQNTIKKYSEDVKFSAIRTFNVRFKGVHIEVEIPKQ